MTLLLWLALTAVGFLACAGLAFLTRAWSPPARGAALCLLLLVLLGLNLALVGMPTVPGR